MLCKCCQRLKKTIFKKKKVSTHDKGHTLDSIITKAEDELVSGMEIRNPMLSDHSAVNCHIRVNNPPLERAKIQYRKLCSVNMERFN